MPLVGAFGGLMTSTLVFIAGCLMHGLFGSFFTYLSYHIPGLFASAYWAHNHWSIRLAVPLMCMALFIAHPVGMYAAPYTLYWLIPVALYFMRTTIFTQALGSTMTAHAVGSVLWIYTIPMSIEQWYGLIPVVAVERLLFATGMVVAHKALSWLLALKHNDLSALQAEAAPSHGIIK